MRRAEKKPKMSKAFFDTEVVAVSSVFLVFMACSLSEKIKKLWKHHNACWFSHLDAHTHTNSPSEKEI